MDSSIEQAQSRLRAVIVDDESLARRGLKLRLAAFDEVEIVAECRNGREALETVARERPDLLFLDVQMPGIDGFEVVRQLGADEAPLIVFVTAFDHYAVEAFKVAAVDYLLKPIDEDRLAEALERVISRRDGKVAEAERVRLLEALDQVSRGRDDGVDRLCIRDGSETHLVPMDSIDWIDAAGDYMCVHAAGETLVMRSTMKALEDELDPKLFARVHRSTIVNVRRVAKVCSHINGEYFLTLECGARLKMSRTYREQIERILAD